MSSWEILGLEPGADRAAIKAAYFAKIRVHTPDGDPERFKQIRAAYEELSAVQAIGGSAAGLRALRFRPMVFPPPQEILAREKELGTGLTIEELIKLTL